MGIQYGNLPISDVKYCDAQGALQNIKRVVRNGSVIWMGQQEEYGGLKFTANADGCMVGMVKTGSDAPSVTLLTSFDGETWTDYNVGNYITLATAGDYVYFKAGPGGNTAFCDPFSFDLNQFSIIGSISASGNIMSLIRDDMSSNEVDAFAFTGLFMSARGLTSAPVLPATTLANYCYAYMFSGCTLLKVSENGGVGSVILNIPHGAIEPEGWNFEMFFSTGGTFTGDPSIGVPYYCYQ